MTLPTNWFADVTAAINQAKSCSDLQNAINKAFDSTLKLQTQIGSQIALLAPLLTTPGDLPGVISWITSYITYVTGPYNALLTQQTQIVTQINSLTAAATAKAIQLGCSGISIPLAE